MDAERRCGLLLLVTLTAAMVLIAASCAVIAVTRAHHWQPDAYDSTERPMRPVVDDQVWYEVRPELVSGGRCGFEPGS